MVERCVVTSHYTDVDTDALGVSDLERMVFGASDFSIGKSRKIRSSDWHARRAEIWVDDSRG